MKLLRTASFALLAGMAASSAQAENCGDTSFFSLAAGACAGSYVGALEGAAAETDALAAQWGGSWAYIGRSDAAGNGPFTSNPQVAFSGLLGFDAPLLGDFVIGLQSGSQYSYYRFNAATALSSLTFSSTEGVATTPQGNPLELSHATLYVTAVPEPGQLPLLVAGLLAVGWTARRRG